MCLLRTCWRSGLPDIATCWVPKLVGSDAKWIRYSMSRDDLAIFEVEQEGFLERFLQWMRPRGPPLPARDKRTIKAVETLSAFQDSQTGEVCGRGGVSLHLLGTKDVQLPGKGSLLKGPTLLIYWDRRKSRRFSMGICHDECSSDKTTLQWRCLPSMNAFHSPKSALSENSSPNVNSDDDVITAVGHLRE